jgi:hypothetical protein
MRWLFLLLVMLNGIYYLWHQQQAPLRPKEVAPLAQYRGAHQDIQLLSESGAGAPPGASVQCLYLGGEIAPNQARIIEQRLTSLDIQTQFGKRTDESGAVYWLQIDPQSRRLIDDAMMVGLVQDFPQLKSKIMSCEGVASAN